MPLAPAVRRLPPWVVLLGLAVLLAAGRAYTLHEPLENDVSGYAVVGHELLLGRPLYTDLWDNKPPLLAHTFAVAERLVRFGPQSILLLNIVAGLATLAGTYTAGRAVGGPAAGLFAAGLWTIVGGDALVQANQPNAEVFVNVGLTWAAAALLSDLPAARPWRTGLAAGVAFAFASLYEHHTVIVAAALSAGYLLAGRPVGRRLGAVAIAAGVGTIAWAGLAVELAATGRLAAAVDVLFVQNLSYGGNLLANLAEAFTPFRLVPSFMLWAIGPVVLVAAALALRAVPTSRGWLVCGGWAAGAFVTVALPGQFWPHYYQVWIPLACVAGGWAAGGLARSPRPLGRVTVVAALTLMAARQAQWFAVAPYDWADRKYPGRNFAEQDYLGRRLASILRPGETFWVLGSDLTIYFTAGHSPPSGVIYMEPLLDPYNGRVVDHLMADLQRTNPPLVVVAFPWDHLLPASLPIVPWLHAHYDRLRTNLTCGTYDLYVRRDDPAGLRRRLENPPFADPFRRARYFIDADGDGKADGWPPPPKSAPSARPATRSGARR